MSARLIEIWEDFFNNKKKFKRAELQDKIKYKNRAFVIKGAFQEALKNQKDDREYQKKYREENRQKLRTYHQNYAKVRRAKQRLGQKWASIENITLLKEWNKKEH